jgi:glutamate synthase (NADPH/NADH) small chain
MYGIPNPKLDKKVVKRRIDLMTKEGVKFVTKTEIGKNYPARKLLKEFDAIAVCVGATKPRDLPIEGRQLKGIHFAMEFLSANTKNLLVGPRGKDFPPNSAADPLRFMAGISAKKKNVIVIGGGDTGTDCVGTSVRHGARNVTQLEIMPKPPFSRAADNPWPQWPKVYKQDYGQEEANATAGFDPRRFLVTAKKFIGDKTGHVKAVEIVNVEWQKDEKGRFIPKEVPGTEKIIDADLVLLAMGFLGPEDTVLAALKLERDERSNAKAAYEKYTTNIKGVFAAGDARRGQSLVVWAINEGRGAAREIDRFLMGSTDLP